MTCSALRRPLIFRVRSDYLARMERVRQMREEERAAISVEREKQRAARAPASDAPKVIKAAASRGIAYIFRA